MTWERGRLLKTYNGCTNSYNAYGIRFKRESSTEKTEFELEGSRILGECTSYSSGTVTNRRSYVYNETGIAGIIISGTGYRFDKNIFGDVVGIYNSSNTLVGKYRYDAWGNCTVVTDTNGIATANPFRYRGYYWDSKLSLYYLQSRYYDPSIRRFINADDISYLDPTTINGLNLFAYCVNNPVMYTDPLGNGPFLDFLSDVGRFIAGMYITSINMALAVATFPLAFIPGAAFIPQTFFSLGMYGGFMMASAFDPQIQADMEAINWNMFNTDISKVSSCTKVSFYQGQSVIRQSISSGSMSFGIMFLGSTSVDTVRHEHGHYLQMGLLGLPAFFFGIAVPSFICATIATLNPTGWIANNYHSLPWEVTADMLGGTTSYTHNPGSESAGWVYFMALLRFAWGII